MAGNNDFLPFSNAVGANVVTQTAYAADPTTPVGFASGVALSSKLNKVWRQSSMVAASLGQLIADVGLNAIDDGAVVNLEKQLTLAFDLSRYGLDTGAVNAHAVSYVPAVSTVLDGVVLRFKAATANTGPTTFSPNGFGALPIVGGNHLALQGGEIIAGSDVWVQYNSNLGCWILIKSTGGSMPIVIGRKSEQAVNLAQFFKSLLASGVQTLPSGLIIQWGSGITGAGGGIAITNPLTFPNAAFAGVATANANAVAANIISVALTTSTTTAYASNGSGSPIASLGVFFIVIGF